MKAAIARLARTAGYEIRKAREFRSDFSPFEREVLQKVRPYTMASDERVVAFMDAVRYVATAGIEGDIVECGVWKGGCMMAAALMLKECNPTRHLNLYDTFAGMPEPSTEDRKTGGDPASAKFQELADGQGFSDWCRSPLDEVRGNMLSTGYDPHRILYYMGKVENTLPDLAPERIAVLRLDTDWYESTKHELIHLYPRLSKGGVLLIDDYGSWDGARKAVDEYFSDKPLLLSRTDGQGRMAVKH